MAVNTRSFTIGRWTNATFIGWLLGVFLILLLSSILDAAGIQHMQFYLGIGMGAGVGFAQWWMTRKMLELDTRWIWASLFGMGGSFIFFDFFFSENASTKLISSVLLGAFATGLLQYLLLRKKSARAQLWIIGCFIGWSLAVIMVRTIDYTMTIKAAGYLNLLVALLNLLIILSGGLILGFVTGITFRKIKGAV